MNKCMHIHTHVKLPLYIAEEGQGHNYLTGMKTSDSQF